MKSQLYLLFILTAILSTSCSTRELIPIKSSEKQIKSFSFKTLNINATIDTIQRNIITTLPFGTNASNLSPTIIISNKATISPASDVIQNFTKPVLYTVTAEDGSSQTFTVNIIAPPKSSKPTSTLVSSNVIKLEWAKIDNIKSYKIYRNNVAVYEGSNSFFEDIGLTAETTYTYNLTLVNEFGESPKSEALTVKTLPLTLADVVDDKSYVNYLPFEWQSYNRGKGYKSDYYTISFESNSTKLEFYHSYNNYEFILDSKSETKYYSFKIEKDVIYIYDDFYKKFVKFIRIEKVSLDQFRAYRISESTSSYSEYLMGVFDKADFVEQNREEVIKNSEFLNKMTGIWKEADETSFLPNKNISYDFSENKNFFWKRYQTYDGSKKSEKYQFKIDAQGKFFTRYWGVAYWKSVNIKYDASKNILIVDGKQWYR